MGCKVSDATEIVTQGVQIATDVEAAVKALVAGRLPGGLDVIAGELAALIEAIKAACHRDAGADVTAGTLRIVRS
jgi:hypothetical protein